LAATDYLPIPTETILAVVRTRTKEKFLASNLKAFELGAAAARDSGNWQRRSLS
jgi:Pyruvate/2-oxoacid:ferredoxin oxidoreductase gamma subunit